MPGISRGMRQERLPAMCGPSMFLHHSAFAAAVSFFVLLLSSAHATTPYTLVAKIERVSDGDTFRALPSKQDGAPLKTYLSGRAVEWVRSLMPR